MFDFTYERTIASVKQSLARLQLDYIDVIQASAPPPLLVPGSLRGAPPPPLPPPPRAQVHDPEFAPSLDLVLAETLPALRQCQKEGLVK